MKNEELLEENNKMLELVCKGNKDDDSSEVRCQFITPRKKLLHVKFKNLREASMSYITKNGDVYKYFIH